jgi:hypothetical protein
VLNAILDPISDMLLSRCRLYRSLVSSYFYNLSGNLWPFQEIHHQKSLAQILQKMTEFPELTIEHCTNGICPCRKLNFAVKLQNAKERISGEKRGLCLDCILTGRESFRTKSCRVSHASEYDQLPEPPRKRLKPSRRKWSLAMF